MKGRLENHGVCLGGFIGCGGKHEVKVSPAFKSNERAESLILKTRRVIGQEQLNSNERLMTLTNFPRMGTTINPTAMQNLLDTEVLRSQYLPDEMLGPLVKNKTIPANIRSRRGRKVELNAPVFRDENTPWPFHDPTVNYNLHRWPEDDDVRNGAMKENHIYIDNLLFGVGSCYLQVTMQA